MCDVGIAISKVILGIAGACLSFRFFFFLGGGEQAGVEVGYLPSTPGTRVQIPGRASE